MPQTVFYQDGIGASPYLFQRLLEGATGTSLDLKVMEAYSFIVDNYQEGDQLFFFGFSRGAYTARTVAAFVNYIGILSKQERSVSLNTLWHAFNQRNPSDPNSITKAEETVFKELNRWPSGNAMFSAMTNSKIQDESIPKQNSAIRITSPKKGESMDKILDSSTAPVTLPIQTEYLESEEAINKRTPKVVPPKIEVIGVFDTVGALGVPGRFMNPQKMQYYSFFDPMLAPNVRHAFHAISLGEDRKDFLPTIWSLPKQELSSDAEMRKGQELKQVWFQGSHSDVGGGHPWHGLSDITLAWMISQLVDRPKGEAPLLNIDIDLARTLQDFRLPWAKQPEHPSRTSIMFQETRLFKGWSIPKKLTKTAVWRNTLDQANTHEYIHHSVIEGKQYDPKTSPQFDLLRKNHPDDLDTLWAQASDPESLGNTEKVMRWTLEESIKARSQNYSQTPLFKPSNDKVPLDDPELPPSKPNAISPSLWKVFMGIAYAPVLATSYLMNWKRPILERTPVPQRNLEPPKLLSLLQKLDRDPQQASQPLPSLGNVEK